jgi:hypothetical protein
VETVTHACRVSMAWARHKVDEACLGWGTGPRRQQQPVATILGTQEPRTWCWGQSLSVQPVQLPHSISTRHVLRAMGMSCECAWVSEWMSQWASEWVGRRCHHEEQTERQEAADL